MKRFVGIFLALAMTMALLAASGCEEEADCASACEHQCDVCDTGCDPTQVDACIDSCVNMDTSPSRTDCIINAPTCDGIWEC